MTVPDPASRFQPDDVHGESLIVDPARLRMDGRGLEGASVGGSRPL